MLVMLSTSAVAESCSDGDTPGVALTNVATQRYAGYCGRTDHRNTRPPASAEASRPYGSTKDRATTSQSWPRHMPSKEMYWKSHTLMVVSLPAVATRLRS